MDKTHSRNRDTTPFVVRVEHADGEVRDYQAAAVVDASGTWSTRNPLGTSGLPAVGETAAAAHVSSPLPDVLGRDREAFAGRTAVVIGAGHSAANTLINLSELADQVPGTKIVWAIRGASAAKVYGGGDADGLAARGQLGSRLRALVEAGTVELHTGFGIAGLAAADGAVTLTAADGRTLEADVVVPATGFRPNLDMLRELRLELDPGVEAPRELGPLIDPEFHSCGTVEPHGARMLAHPEQDFYIVGMKSYGRAPDLPAGHRLRTGPLRRGRPGRRPRGRGHRPARTAGDRRLLLGHRHQLRCPRRRTGRVRSRNLRRLLRSARTGPRRVPHRTGPRPLRRKLNTFPRSSSTDHTGVLT